MGKVNQQIIIDQFSTPSEGVCIRDGEYKSPGPKEITIKTGYCPINPADLNVIEGKYGKLPKLPAIIGNEGSGHVVEVGKDCENLSEGDHVLYLNRQDCWQQFVTATPEDIIKLPNSLPLELSSMLKVNPATAWLLLKQFPLGNSPKWLVQNASNSGVGVAVIQLAKTFGIKTINFVRREECKEQLISMGADVVLMDNETGKKEALELLKEKDIELPLAINAVGGESALRLMSLLSTNGTHVTYGAMSKRPLKIPNSFLIFKNLTIKGLWLSRWLYSEKKDRIEEVYHKLANKMLEGNINQPVDSIYDIDQLVEAINRSMQEGRKGKVLINFHDRD